MKHLVFVVIFFLYPVAVTTSAMAQQTDSTEERAPASTDGHVVTVDARGDAGGSEAGSNSDENKRLMPDASENGDATATQEIDSKIPKRHDTEVEESAGPGKTDTISTDDKEEDKPKEKQNREQKRKKDKALPLEIEAKIHTRWEMTHYKEDVLRRDDLGSVVLDENGDPVLAKESVRYNEFKIQRARLKLTWTPARWVSARLQVGDFQEAGNAASLLKDAYLHLAPSRYLEVRIGQFKKPFSRIELRGSATLKVAERGIGNSLIVEHFTSDSLSMIREDDRLQYGDRDIGIQLSGRLLKSVKLDYEVGVFNGTGPVLTRKANSKDAALRITVTPSDWVKLGVNGSLKLFDKEERERENFSGENTALFKHPGWAAGADALFEAAGVRLHLEALLALDYRVIDQETPLVLNGIAILSYIRKFDVSWKLAVEPVFKMEVLDPSSVYVNDIVMLYSPGFNVYLGKWVRLMIHADIQRVSRYTSESLYRKRNQRSSEQLIAQFCFDI